MSAVPVDPNPISPSAFGVGFTIVVVPVALGAAYIVVSLVRNVAKVRASGHDPMTLQTDLAVKLLDSSALAPGPRFSTRSDPTGPLAGHFGPSGPARRPALSVMARDEG